MLKRYLSTKLSLDQNLIFRRIFPEYSSDNKVMDYILTLGFDRYYDIIEKINKKQFDEIKFFFTKNITNLS